MSQFEDLHKRIAALPNDQAATDEDRAELAAIIREIGELAASTPGVIAENRNRGQAQVAELGELAGELGERATRWAEYDAWRRSHRRGVFRVLREWLFPPR